MDVALVGAGSLSFTGPLLRKLLPVAAEHGLRIMLCDLDEAALGDMQRIAERLAGLLGCPLQVAHSTTLDEALAEAAFVTVTLNHGGLGADIADFTNAVEHGFLVKHVDTIGPAGWLRALRMGAFQQRLLAAMPADATLLNLSNPLSFLLRMAHLRGRRAVGFCHGAANRATSFKAWLDLPAEPRPVVFGTNHLTWTTELTVDGEDVTERLVDFLRSSPDHRHWRLNLELYDRYGTMPILEAQHMADFFGGFNRPEALDAYGLHLWDGPSRVGPAEERTARRRALAAGELAIDSLAPSRESVAEIVSALLGGPVHHGIHNLPLATPANGLPAGGIAEHWCTVDSAGPRLDPPPALPRALHGQLERVHRQQDLAARGCLEDDLDLLIEALALEPNVPDAAVAGDLVRRAIAERPHLFPDAWRRWG